MVDVFEVGLEGVDSSVESSTGDMERKTKNAGGLIKKKKKKSITSAKELEHTRPFIHNSDRGVQVETDERVREGERETLWTVISNLIGESKRSTI